ncbi:MAG: hypothetical protein MI974_20305 [Chitinophagales bacterium]|nr:hypothetical protein [Chitinophagales bacterium]
MEKAAGINSNTSHSKGYIPEPLLVLGYKALLNHIISNFQSYSFTHSKSINMDHYLQLQCDYLMQSLGNPSSDAPNDSFETQSRVHIQTRVLINQVEALLKDIERHGTWGKNFKDSFLTIIKGINTFLRSDIASPNKQINRQIEHYKMNIRKDQEMLITIYSEGKRKERRRYKLNIIPILNSLKLVESLLLEVQEGHLRNQNLRIIR